VNSNSLKHGTTEEVVLCTAIISPVTVVVTERGLGFTQALWELWNQSTIAPTCTLQHSSKDQPQRTVYGDCCMSGYMFRLIRVIIQHYFSS
jgi:hypothetical protein